MEQLQLRSVGRINDDDDDDDVSFKKKKTSSCTTSWRKSGRVGLDACVRACGSSFSISVFLYFFFSFLLSFFLSLLLNKVGLVPLSFGCLPRTHLPPKKNEEKGIK